MAELSKNCVDFRHLIYEKILLLNCWVFSEIKNNICGATLFRSYDRWIVNFSIFTKFRYRDKNIIGLIQKYKWV